MKRALLLFSAGITLAAAAPSPARPADRATDHADNALQRIIPNVLTVTAFNAHGQRIMQRTGLLLDSDRIITQRLVFDGARRAEVQFGDGSIQPVDAVLADNFTADLAIARVRNAPRVVPVAIHTGPVAAGTQASAVQGTAEHVPRISPCLVAGVRDRPGGLRMLQLDCALPDASLGSPLCNDVGELIGIVVTAGGTAQRSFAVEAGQIEMMFGVLGRGFDVGEWSRHAIHRIASDASDVSTEQAGYFEDDPDNMRQLANEADQRGIEHKKKLESAKALNSFWVAILLEPYEAAPWSDAAECALNLRRFPDAIRMYENAARLEPAVRSRWELLGALTLKLQRYEESRDAWLAILERNPADGPAWTNLGSAYAQLGQDSAALDAYQRAVRLQPRDANAMLNLGQFHRLHHRDSLAERSLRAAIALNPNLVDAWASLGDLLIGARRWGDAVPVYKELTARDPKDAMNWNRYGGALWFMHRFDEAIAPLQTAARLKPDDANPHRFLLKIYAERDRFREAVGECKAILRLDPRDADAHYFYGLAQLFLYRDKKAAREECDVLMTIDTARANALRDVIEK